MLDIFRSKYKNSLIADTFHFFWDARWAFIFAAFLALFLSSPSPSTVSGNYVRIYLKSNFWIDFLQELIKVFAVTSYFYQQATRVRQSRRSKENHEALIKQGNETASKLDAATDRLTRAILGSNEPCYANLSSFEMDGKLRVMLYLLGEAPIYDFSIQIIDDNRHPRSVIFNQKQDVIHPGCADIGGIPLPTANLSTYKIKYSARHGEWESFVAMRKLDSGSDIKMWATRHDHTRPNSRDRFIEEDLNWLER